jgi:hypothetical protein
LFNHDLRQVFVGASDRPMGEMARECDDVAHTIEDWEATRHRIERIEAVEQFATLQSARMYASWLNREGAFENLEDYAMGFDPALA